MIFRLTSLRSRNSSAMERKLLTYFRCYSSYLQSEKKRKREEQEKREKECMCVCEEERDMRRSEKSEKCRLARHRSLERSERQLYVFASAKAPHNETL